MKKYLKIITVVIMIAMLSIVFIACNKNKTYNVEVQYVNDGNEAIGLITAGSAKFAVLGEPAATMAGQKAGATYRIDLQAEWKKTTGFDGYPQASTLATGNVLQNHSDFLKKFLYEMQTNASWIVENATIINDILQANGSKSKFNSAAVIQNCNIRYEKAIDAKASVNKYLEIMQSFKKEFVGETLPNDAFYADFTPDNTVMLQDKAEKTVINVYVPDGAPALAIAKLLQGVEFPGYTVNYTIVPGADQISAAIANGSADIAILPTNIGAKLYSNGKDIKLVASNVFGLLYLVGTEEIKSLTDLNGQKILCTGQGGTPDFVLQYLFSKNNITIG